MDENSIRMARLKRARLSAVADFILSKDDALESVGKDLEWEDIDSLPEWYLWDREQFDKLVLIAGIVFLLPTIRLWIESKKIDQVKALIGQPVYEFIMQYTLIGYSPIADVDMGEFKRAVETAGASVVLSSQDRKLQPWLIYKLPSAEGQLDKNLATELLNHSLFVLTQTSQSGHPAEDEPEN
jgi:hypothetical protein